MDSNKSNSDLLKCENEFYVNSSLKNRLLITKTAQKNTINSQTQQNSIKTEKISSTVLSRAKDFLDKAKLNENVVEGSCDLVTDQTVDCQSDGQQIEMNLLLFQNNNELHSDSSSESSHSSTEDSEQDSDSDQHSNEDCVKTKTKS